MPPKGNKSEGEDDFSSAQSGRSNRGNASIKQSLSFPTWDSDKRDEWQTFSMRVRTFMRRTGSNAVYEVAMGSKDIADFEMDEDFHDYNETLHCDLVLNIKGSGATEILQSSNDTFTDAWPKLLREFGTTTSIRRMELVRQLVTLSMDNYHHEMPKYKAACMELSRRVKEAKLSIEDVIIYSVLFGLDENYDAYKLITQDKIDQGNVVRAEDIIENLTNSSEVLSNARNIQSYAPINVDSYGKYHSGKANHTRKSGLKCEHCGKTGHAQDGCFELHPEKAPKWWKMKQENDNGEASGNPSLKDQVNGKSAKVSLKTELESMKNSGANMTIDKVRAAVNRATEL